MAQVFHTKRQRIFYLHRIKLLSQWKVGALHLTADRGNISFWIWQQEDATQHEGDVTGRPDLSSSKRWVWLCELRTEQSS